MDKSFSFAICGESRRQDYIQPVRRIVAALGNRDLTDAFSDEDVNIVELIDTLDVLALAIREEPDFWCRSHAAKVLERFEKNGKPFVLPFVIDDIVVVNRCSENPAAAALFSRAKPSIVNMDDPSAFSKALVTQVDRVMGRKTSRKQLDRISKREHAQHERKWKHLLEFSWDQGERNLLAAATDLFDCLLESAIEGKLRNDQNSFQWLFGPERPLGSFSAKIHLAFLLGVLTEEEKRELDIIRGLRNRFAHDFRLATIRDEQSLVDKCDALTLFDEASLPEFSCNSDLWLEDPSRGLRAVAKLESSVEELARRLRRIAVPEKIEGDPDLH